MIFDFALHGVIFGRVPLAGYVCIALCMMFEVVSCSLIFGFRHRLGYLFVDDEDVVELASKIAYAPLLPLSAQHQLLLFCAECTELDAPFDTCRAM